MKKAWIAFVLTCSALVAAPAADAFNFVRFNAGLPVAFPIDDTINNGDPLSGKNFGIDIAAFDNLTVGYDALILGAAAPIAIKGLRLGYSVSPKLGIALDLGSNNGDPAAVIGVFSNVAGGKTKVGIIHGLSLRADYVIPDTDDIGAGAIVLSVGAYFGY
ncbi:MAG: hypothetical protein LBE89_05440 [Helicobacteraceae bacterium]|jgi:hypothetical protein|nr:hypothetical protein [Helicobacteraceae bacterium]